MNFGSKEDQNRNIGKGVDLHFIQHPYLEFILQGGGTTILLPNLNETDNLSEIVRHLDGILLIGGIDVDPYNYNMPNTHSEGCNLMRDETELVLIKEARKQSKAIMGICRGVQILNTAFGGTLYQHIPEQINNALKHHRAVDEPEVFHQAYLTGKSYLSDIFGSNEFQVNSSHHQSLNQIGEGLKVVARASDGVVEAVECTTEKCIIGVQWHPERIMNNPKQVELAKYFVARASN